METTARAIHALGKEKGSKKLLKNSLVSDIKSQSPSLTDASPTPDSDEQMSYEGAVTVDYNQFRLS
jgi:hypothetical protein